MVVITLKSLPKSYEHFIKTLNVTTANVDLKFSDLCTILLQQDRWKQQFGSGASSSSIEQAFLAKTVQKNKGKNQPSQQPSQAQSSDSSKKKNVQCNYCQKYGHMKKDCRKHLASEQNKQGESKPKANVVEHTEQKESAFYAFMAKSPADPVKSSAWYIDSSAFGHFTHRWDWFIEYTPFRDSIIFGGGEEYTIVGKGNAQIHFGERNLIFLDVYFVLGMELNLLSVSQIMTHSP